MLLSYLLLDKYIIRTNYEALHLIRNFPKDTGRIENLRMRPLQYACEVMHRPGSVDKAPDALSRLVKTGFDTNPLEDNIPTLYIYSAASVHYLSFSDYDKDSSPDDVLRAGQRKVFKMASAAAGGFIQTDIFLPYQAANLHCM